MPNLDEFTKSIDVDLVWRKKEVSNLILLSSDENEKIIVKSSILMIYSHWEGYVKNACKLYLDYVSSCSILLSDLTNNYHAIDLKGRIKQAFSSSESLTLTNELALMESIEDGNNSKFKLSKKFKENEKDKSIINTKDNLNFKVFSSLLSIVGIQDRECLETKELFLDEKLLNNRNKIAHGSKVESYSGTFDMDIGDVKMLKDFVFTIMDSLADDLKYYAESEFYLKENHEKCSAYNQESSKSLDATLRTLFD